MRCLGNRNRSRRCRGVAVLFVAVTLVTLLLFASLAVDVGYICALTAEQQNTADAGALGGAVALQEADSMSVLDRVLDIIARNQRAQGYLSLDDQIIEIGAWDSINRTFSALPPEDWEKGAFAVRVRAARNNAELFFAALMGKYSTDVSREAVAVGSGPCGGIWGLEGVDAGSITTDSYDSTAGSYDESTAHENGDLCSGRDIKVRGSFGVEGDVMSGFGYDVTVAGGAGEITGITTSNMTGVTGPTVDFVDVTSINDNETLGLTDNGVSPWKKSGWNLNMQGGDNLRVEGGVYYFDSIKLSGGATLTIAGPCTFYVAGSIDATGGAFVNEAHDPHNLSIISSGSDVKISGGTVFYGSILAPYADVVLSGNDAGFYGAVVGRTVDLLGDYSFHVDESLALSNWYEPPPPMLVK